MKVLSRNHNKHAVRKGLQPVYQQPNAWLLLRIWGIIGLQSFGGGASTLFLIQHEFMDKRDWLTQEEFNHLWGLCLMAPGINIIAVTILIGRKLSGFWGIIASLVGLLLPSAAITCLLTAGFQLVENSHIVQAILQGVIPATGGIMLLVGVRFAVPLLKQGRMDGLLKLAVGLVIIAGVAVAIIVLKITIPLVLLCAALVGIAFFSAAPSSPALSSSSLPEPTSAEEKP
ncbi:MAG TPA: chromate transporter [Ktedonobacteraceae bacterium]|nr:chromate transporter [Ktedonobacteraceae bacterium]